MTRSHLHAVALLVSDYDEGLAFCVGVLGFELRQDKTLTADKRWILVAPPGAETALLLARAATPEQNRAVGRQAGGRVGFFLQTGDFAVEHARLSAAGVIFEEEPRHEPYGTVAVFRDPFGNRWDLLQLS
ncbi:VOC family protein [Aestuariibius insulae]|uniref:VOC family protein n=1 Tax=Aestuariibius insulae TaxID=2058287 RepID=UPI00345E0E71